MMLSGRGLFVCLISRHGTATPFGDIWLLPPPPKFVVNCALCLVHCCVRRVPSRPPRTPRTSPPSLVARSRPRTRLCVAIGVGPGQPILYPRVTQNIPPCPVSPSPAHPPPPAHSPPPASPSHRIPRCVRTVALRCQTRLPAYRRPGWRCRKHAKGPHATRRTPHTAHRTPHH